MIRSCVRFLIFVFLCAFCIVENCDAATLHAIMVGDTQDESIGEGVQRDLATARRRLNEIASFSSMELSVKQFYEASFDSETVMRSLRELKVENDDTIFFYYSGHGFRTELNKGVMPALFFGFGDYSLDTGKIADMLEKKGARMLLVISDSCNNNVSLAFAPLMYPTESEGYFYGDKSQRLRRRANIKTLFRDFRGTIEVGAAVPGEPALGTAAGGIYSIIFWTKLIEMTSREPQVDWKILLDEVADQVFSTWEQLPVYSVKKK